MLFASGGANASASFAPIAKKIAAVLDKEPGDVTVTGYTDGDPIKTVALSVELSNCPRRAREVGRRDAQTFSERSQTRRGERQGRGRSRRAQRRRGQQGEKPARRNLHSPHRQPGVLVSWAFWLWIALSVLGALLLAALIWFAGPLIAVADYAPLEGTGVRSDHRRR